MRATVRTLTAPPDPSVRKRPPAARGTVTLYRPPRVKMWYLRYSLGGKQRCEPTGTRDEKQARQLRNTRQAELTLGLAVPQATRTTFDELAQMVEEDFDANKRPSLERTKDALRNLGREFLGERAAAITTDQITKYQRMRQGEGAANSTINRETGVLRRGFNLGRRAGKVAHVPYVPKLKEAPPRSGFFEYAEFQTVLAGLPDYLKAPVSFMFYTGWRKQEVLSLTWRQVDLRAGIVRLEPGTTKNDEGREFPFDVLAALGDLLRRQRERTTAVEKATGQIVPHVFHRHGKPVLDLRKAWATATRTAGLAGKLLHDFRRTAVRNLERAGVPRSVSMKLTGHKTQSVFQRYAITNEADLREGVAKLAALHQAAAGAERVVVPLPGAAGVRTSKV